MCVLTSPHDCRRGPIKLRFNPGHVSTTVFHICADGSQHGHAYVQFAWAKYDTVKTRM